MITEQEINEVYGLQKGATERLFLAAEHASKMKTVYETKVAVALANGEVEGSNESKRKACAQAMFGNDYECMVVAEEAERAAKLEFDLLTLEVARVRALLRLMEIVNGMTMAG